MCPTRVSGSPCGREPWAREPVDEDDGVCLTPVKCGGRGGCPSACLHPPPAMGGGGGPAVMDQQGQSRPGAPLREAASHRPVPRRPHTHTHVHTLALACAWPCPSWWSAPRPPAHASPRSPTAVPSGRDGGGPWSSPPWPGRRHMAGCGLSALVPFLYKAGGTRWPHWPPGPASCGKSPDASLCAHGAAPRPPRGPSPSPGPPRTTLLGFLPGERAGASTTSQLCLLHLQGGASQGRPRREEEGSPCALLPVTGISPLGHFQHQELVPQTQRQKSSRFQGPAGRLGVGGALGRRYRGDAPFPASQKVTL